MEVDGSKSRDPETRKMTASIWQQSCELQQQLCIRSDHSWKFRVDRLSRRSLFYFTADSGQATQLDKKRLSEHMENSPPQFVLFLQNI